MNMYFEDDCGRKCRIDVDRIELIEQHMAHKSTIYLQGGASITVKLTLDEFEKEILEFEQSVQQQLVKMAASQTREYLKDMEERE